MYSSLCFCKTKYIHLLFSNKNNKSKLQKKLNQKLISFLQNYRKNDGKRYRRRRRSWTVYAAEDGEKMADLADYGVVVVFRMTPEMEVRGVTLCVRAESRASRDRWVFPAKRKTSGRLRRVCGGRPRLVPVMSHRQLWRLWMVTGSGFVRKMHGISRPSHLYTHLISTSMKMDSLLKLHFMQH